MRTAPHSTSSRCKPPSPPRTGVCSRASARGPSAAPSLESLADTARVRGFGEMMVALEQTDDLGEEVETMVYRVVEEALVAVGVAHSVLVRTSSDSSELIIEVAGPRHPIARQRLAVLRA